MARQGTGTLQSRGKSDGDTTPHRTGMGSAVVDDAFGNCARYARSITGSLLNDGVFRAGDVAAPVPTIVDAIYDASREETLELSQMPTR